MGTGTPSGQAGWMANSGKLFLNTERWPPSEITQTQSFDPAAVGMAQARGLESNTWRIVKYGNYVEL